MPRSSNWAMALELKIAYYNRRCDALYDANYKYRQWRILWLIELDRLAPDGVPRLKDQEKPSASN